MRERPILDGGEPAANGNSKYGATDRQNKRLSSHHGISLLHLINSPRTVSVSIRGKTNRPENNMLCKIRLILYLFNNLLKSLYKYKVLLRNCQAFFEINNANH